MYANNFKPHFTTSSGVITIKEDVKVGSMVFVLSASDNENDPMYFSLDSTGQSLFNVGSLNADQKSVNLTLKTKLNRELTSNYEFKAFVSDKQNDETRRGEKTFFVTVIDVNDNKPVFITQPYKVSVPETWGLLV
ncbi:Protein dachsous [Exaiptasia diaphana]|nr:Protein dachsous [Exaiptasia diaphana]